MIARLLNSLPGRGEPALNFFPACAEVLYLQSANAAMVRPLEEKGIDVLAYMAAHTEFLGEFYRTYADSQRQHVDAIQAKIGEPRAILDIGCGLGLPTLFLYRKTGAKLWLLDSGGDEAKKAPTGFHDSYHFTAKLDVTRTFLERNGVPASQIHAVDITAQPFPTGPFDLVFSKRAWGFHFPLATYLEAAVASLAENGRIITDVRKGTTDLTDVAVYLPKVEVLIDGSKSQTILATR